MIIYNNILFYLYSRQIDRTGDQCYNESRYMILHLAKYEMIGVRDEKNSLFDFGDAFGTRYAVCSLR